MNLLILTPYIPYPANSGGNQVFFGLVDQLRKHIDVSIILPVKKSDRNNLNELQNIWKNVRIFDFPINNSSTTLSPLYNCLTNIRNSIDRKLKRKETSLINDLARKNSVLTSFAKPFYLPLDNDYVNFVHDVIQTNNFDLIQVEFVELLNVVSLLPKDIKKVFTHHEIRYVRAERELELFKETTPMDYYLLNNAKIIEMQFLNHYDAIITLTDIDRLKLLEELRSDMPIAVSPVIIEEKSPNTNKPFKFNNRLVFIGGSDHFPNLDGVDWFLNNCWSKIISINEDFEFHIIGKWHSKIVKEYTKKHPNVIFKGFVNDLSAELENSIMIVPLRIGSGVRIKILDGLNNRTPIVTTYIGGEGLHLINNEDCLIADSSEEFIQAIISLSQNNDLCNKLSLNAINKQKLRPKAEDLAKIRLDIYYNILNLSSN